jgi:hypothetical protein
MFELPKRIAILLFLIAHAHGQVLLAGGRGKALLDRTTRIGPLVNNMVIDLAKTPSLNVKASAKCLKKSRVSSISFFLDGSFLGTDSTAPYWMMRDKGSAWNPTTGNHTIYAKAYHRNDANGRKMLKTTTSVIVVDTRTKTPMAAPVTAPIPPPPISAPMMAPMAVPMAAPVVAPVVVSAPATVPVSAPVLAPASVPVLVTAPAAPAPASIPLSAPVSAPMATQVQAPTMVPNAPTKPPTLAPSIAPTKAPLAPTNAPIRNCDLNTVEYINCITFSNRSLTLTGTTVEDRALQWLVFNDTLAMTPNSEANKTRLRQRFALLSFGLKLSSGGKLVFQSDKWNLTAMNECNWYTLNKCKNGQVTEIYSYASTGTLPPDLCLLTAMTRVTIPGGGMTGTLPPQVGLWTNLTYFYVGSNSMNGTLPSSIGAWTAITEMYVGTNQFSGTIPVSVGAWKTIANVDFTSNRLSGIIPSAVLNWTTLDTAYFGRNNFYGTMPTFGGGFCPKLVGQGGKGSALQANCKSITGPPKISCACCNSCV